MSSIYVERAGVVVIIEPVAKKISINVISDSAFSVQVHGVHTAYIEHLNGLRNYSGFEVHTNQKNFHSDIVHVHTIGPYGLRFILSKRGLKFVSAHVVPDSFVGSLVGARLWYPLAKLYLKWFYNKADGVFAVSHEVADQLRKMGVKKPIYVVPNMIETSVFTNSPSKKALARKNLHLPKNKFAVICSGQVQPRKRIDSFLYCAKQLPDIQFIWVGGIPFKRVAASYGEMQKIMQNAPNNVIFTGIVTRHAVIQYYWASDMFFLPSEQETFGIVIIEGAAAGLPVLLRNNQQYKKTFNGWYLSASDDSGFVEQIKRLSTDKAYYDSARSKSSHIVKTYATQNVMQEINQIYLSSLKKKV